MIKSALTLLEQLIAPHLCPICDVRINDRGLCPKCWHRLKFITGQACHLCSTPFDVPVMTKGAHQICGQCLIDPPDFDHAAASLVYADPTRQMILALKHGDRQDIAPILARMMAAKTLPLIDQADVILPPPLHHTRFFKRRFNQSAELTRLLLKYHGNTREMSTKTLIRHKATPPQGRKTKAQRIAAMRGAFSVPHDQHEAITGKDILIIDDVLTTGASLSAAARALKRAGARHISVSTVAKVC